MLIAVFLPRVDSNTFARVAQNTLIQSGDGWWFVGLSVAAAVTAWFSYQSRKAGPGMLILGVIAIGVAIFYGANKSSLTLCPVDQGAASPLGIGCSKASPGVGIYAAGVGGLLVVIGGWQMWRAPVIDYEEDDEEVEGEPEDERPGDELAARLRGLESLRESGLVTDDEYAERRHALLDQL